MIKNEKIVRWLCKWFKPEGLSKVRIGDVVINVMFCATVLIVVLIAGGIVAYCAGSIVCAILSDSLPYREDLLQVYTDADILLHGVRATIGLIIVVLVGDMLYNIELAECPLQKGENETEETE